MVWRRRPRLPASRHSDLAQQLRLALSYIERLIGVYSIDQVDRPKVPGLLRAKSAAEKALLGARALNGVEPAPTEDADFRGQ
jgi:hypothetical protein